MWGSSLCKDEFGSGDYVDGYTWSYTLKSWEWTGHNNCTLTSYPNATATIWTGEYDALSLGASLSQHASHSKASCTATPVHALTSPRACLCVLSPRLVR